jgi:lipoprotein-anchoring transpeptidase ErfK/SrfK
VITPPHPRPSTGGRVTNREGNRRGWTWSATTVALLVLSAVALLAAPAASGGRAASRVPLFALVWSAPTPPDGKTFTVTPGSQLNVTLSADGEGAAQIAATGLSAGATLKPVPGGKANAVLTWTPRATQLGTHVFAFAGRSLSGKIVTQPRTIFVQVVPATQPTAGQIQPVGTNGVYRWAYLLHDTIARSRPSRSARVVTRLSGFTSDDTVNLVLLLASTHDASGRVWYRVRLPILPNGSTGWIASTDLTTTRAVTTYLVVYRKLFNATLYRNGRPVFRTRVGVGKPYWPTPAGDFYIREIMTGFNDPFYGPVAFGTSARSAVLTDWPGGGVIGIHGTSLPSLLPGRVSHGCVRMKNGPVWRLHQLMPLGTPVAIR